MTFKTLNIPAGEADIVLVDSRDPRLRTFALADGSYLVVSNKANDWVVVHPPEISNGFHPRDAADAFRRVADTFERVAKTLEKKQQK